MFVFDTEARLHGICDDEKNLRGGFFLHQLTATNLAKRFTRDSNSMANPAINGIDIIRTISPNDQMFEGDEGQYFAIGRSALECISCSLHAASLPANNVGRILDLPCGHGRVLRHLKAAFPGAKITACDLLHDGVNYCATTFGAAPVYSDEDPSKVRLESDTFDLIWVGSLLTHLNAGRWTGFLELFRRSLRPGGVLVFTTHGRRAYDWWVQEVVDYGLPYWRKTAVLFAFERTGFGYADYLTSGSYGLTLSRPDWVFRQIDRVPRMRLAYFSEAAWAEQHDVYACVRDGGWEVQHAPTSTWTFFKHKLRERVRPKGWRVGAVPELHVPGASY
jgi:SAM-dependent methyltransferase